jgi:enoyl-CoA hydratase/carnithine racemase
LPSLERREDVFVIDFGNDENRANHAWVDEMNDLLDQIEKTEGPAALVTTGQGKFYSSGLDTDYMAANPDEIGPYVASVERVCARILVAPLPTIAAVNGHAFGIGAFLTIAHDQAVMREDRGYVCWPEIDLSMAFPRQMLELGRARLATRTLHEAFTSGHRYTSAEAIAAGFVVQAVPEGEVLDCAIARVAPLARQASKTLGRIKRQLHGAVLAAG